MCEVSEAVSGVLVGNLLQFFCVKHMDRRRVPDRRQGERRMFPRPERRRHNEGRRATDKVDESATGSPTHR